MASGGVPNQAIPVCLDRVLDHIGDTLCNTIEVEKVASLLTKRDDCSKKLRRLVKKISTQDAWTFFAVLKKFDFKNFVIFVEVVHQLSEMGGKENKYLQLFHSLCSELKNLEEWSQLKCQKSTERLNALMVLHGDHPPLMEIKFRKNDEGDDIQKEKRDLTSLDEPLTTSRLLWDEDIVQKVEEGVTLSEKPAAISETLLEEPIVQKVAEDVASSEKPLEISKTFLEEPIKEKGDVKLSEKPSQISILKAPLREPIPSVCQHKLLTRSQCIEKKFLYFEADEELFCSHTHGVCITVSRHAVPCKSLCIALSVNSFSGKVVYPDDYDASYSALVSLTCDPAVEFLDHVTVTIPHCAHGDLDALCVLSAPELCESEKNESVIFSEEEDIVIQSISDSYLTFQTKHFSMHKLGKTMKKRKQKLKMELKGISSKRGHSGQRFIAVRCERKEDLIRHCSFFITYHQNSFIKVIYCRSCTCFEIISCGTNWSLSSTHPHPPLLRLL